MIREQIMRFLQKRWVRIVGIVPMSIYSYFAITLVIGLVRSTIFRPPNIVFSGNDIVGWMGFAFFLFLIAVSGVLAILTAYFMRGVFNALYVSGALALYFAIFFVPMEEFTSPSYDLSPKIHDPSMLLGKWMDARQHLELLPDSTYTLIYDSRSLPQDAVLDYNGTWSLKHNNIHLSSLHPRWDSPWEVTYSDGYYFITYTIPENPDAWLGDLGLMEEEDWLDTH